MCLFQFWHCCQMCCETSRTWLWKTHLKVTGFISYRQALQPPGMKYWTKLKINSAFSVTKGHTSPRWGGKGICRLSPSQPLTIALPPSWWYLNANVIKPKHWLPHYQTNLANKQQLWLCYKGNPGPFLTTHSSPPRPLRDGNPLKFCLGLQETKIAKKL